MDRKQKKLIIFSLVYCETRNKSKIYIQKITDILVLLFYFVWVYVDKKQKNQIVFSLVFNQAKNKLKIYRKIT